MKKIGSILVILVVIGVAIYLVINNKKTNKNLPPISQNSTQLSPAQPAISQNTKKYLDKEAGFSFDYPDNLEVTRSGTLKDNEYANLKITGNVSGEITFKAEDTTVKTVADYLLKNKLATEGAQILDTKIADLPAKKYLFKDKIWTLVLDQGVIYFFNADLKNQAQFWASAFEKITSTFTFEKTSVSSSSSFTEDTGGGDIVDEGEEIVE